MPLVGCPSADVLRIGNWRVRVLRVDGAMTSEELATFLRDRLPKIAPLVRLGAATGPKDTGLASIEAQELVAALTAAVGLLRQAEGVIAQAQWGPDMNRCPYCNNLKPDHMGGCWLSDTLTALATLRLVGGEEQK